MQFARSELRVNQAGFHLDAVGSRLSRLSRLSSLPPVPPLLLRIYMDTTMPNDDNRPLSSVVQEVIAEAHLNPSLILPEEIEYIRQHALKKPLRVVHIWSLGVGVV